MRERSARESLNALIHICRDGELGFRAAASHVADVSLKTAFTELAAERGCFADRLTRQLHQIGGQTDWNGTITGTMHRRWMHLRIHFGGASDREIVTEVERGERAAREAYRRALEGTLPAATRPVIERQFTDVRLTHDWIRRLTQSPPREGAIARTAIATLQTPWDCKWTRVAYRQSGIPPYKVNEQMWMCVRAPGALRPVTEQDCEACPEWEKDPGDSPCP